LWGDFLERGPYEIGEGKRLRGTLGGLFRLHERRVLLRTPPGVLSLAQCLREEKENSEGTLAEARAWGAESKRDPGVLSNQRRMSEGEEAGSGKNERLQAILRKGGGGDLHACIVGKLSISGAANEGQCARKTGTNWTEVWDVVWAPGLLGGRRLGKYSTSGERRDRCCL